MDRIYPIEYTYIRIEDILWSRKILRVVKVRAISWGKQPCSLGDCILVRDYLNSSVKKYAQINNQECLEAKLKLWNILIWLDSFPLLSQRTRTVLYSPDISTGSKPRPPVLHVTAVSRVNFLFSFFHKKDISWVIIRIEIKMKSSALLPSNLPRAIDRSGPTCNCSKPCEFLVFILSQKGY